MKNWIIQPLAAGSKPAEPSGSNTKGQQLLSIDAFAPGLTIISGGSIVARAIFGNALKSMLNLYIHVLSNLKRRPMCNTLFVASERVDLADGVADPG